MGIAASYSPVKKCLNETKKQCTLPGTHSEKYLWHLGNSKMEEFLHVLMVSLADRRCFIKFSWGVN